MKLKFKVQPYQTDAVRAVVDCFQGQPKLAGFKYAIDQGRTTDPNQTLAGMASDGFSNPSLAIPLSDVLKNLQEVQRGQDLAVSSELKTSAGCALNLDIEMETGTGKTYCYIKTMFELHKAYGWSKFIVVVPSIAIREGVAQSFSGMAEHFQELYGRKARSFIYNSKDLSNLESFSSDAGINVMIINIQAFNAKGEDARRIYEELDDFQSRRPIDIICKNRPILILDEPQKMEGPATVEGLAKFAPFMILRYSATHGKEHNKVYRLDALDAYNRKLVKKIAVRGITVKGLSGTQPYLYLDSIRISTSKPPEARAEIEVKQATGIKRITRILGKGDNLHELSGGLDQYRGHVVADINALDNTLTFTNGQTIEVGQAVGDVNEAALRRIQIRETIKAHFEKEQALFSQGIKVLSLFFIDEVAKYRSYNEAGEQSGEYALMFEEEYNAHLNEVRTLEDTPYQRHLKGIETSRTHSGYFSVDKKTKRLVNPDVARRGEAAGEANDVDAYDLILKDKETLLQFPTEKDDLLTHHKKQVRFIFSHSALREGWDNPNVFVICTLKHTENNVSRRQEVGRGMRLCRNQNGDRMDDPAIVHQINILTVVANESYKDFVAGLQKDISANLSSRPKQANEAYFKDKVLKTATGDVKVTPQMAKAIEKYLTRQGYTDDNDKVTAAYHQAKEAGSLAALPAELQPYQEQIFKLVDSVFSDAQLPEPENELNVRENPTNTNLNKKEFLELWNRINRKAAYTVHFDTEELVAKCIQALDKELKVTPLHYNVTEGEQTDQVTYESIKAGEGFVISENETEKLLITAQSAVRYDLLGKLTESTQLTRRTIARILEGISKATFRFYKMNPEDFILKTGTVINEQKATVIVEHLSYDQVKETYGLDIFTQQKKQDLAKGFKAQRHVCDYVFTDSGTERTFVENLDANEKDVVVYAKLPKTFFIPTPVGHYTPDWAIAFQEGRVKHVYFVAETKGDMSSMSMRKIEDCKIECARKFFAKITSDQVKYEFLTTYEKLMELVK